MQPFRTRMPTDFPSASLMLQAWRSGGVPQAHPGGEGDSAASPGPGRRWAARAKVAAVIAPVALGALALGGTAQATGYNNRVGFNGYCSLTTPVEYMLQPNGATITSVTPFATKFTAAHVGSGWQDAYWTTGYNHSLSSRGCDTHSTPKGYGRSLPMPAKIGAPFYATLNETMHSGFSAMWAGTFGLSRQARALPMPRWQAAAKGTHRARRHHRRGQPRSGRAHDRRAKWSVSNQNLPAGYAGHAGGWHRDLLQTGRGKGSVQNLNLSAIISDAVVRYGVPASDDWYAIDAGAELPAARSPWTATSSARRRWSRPHLRQNPRPHPRRSPRRNPRPRPSPRLSTACRVSWARRSRQPSST